MHAASTRKGVSASAPATEPQMGSSSFAAGQLEFLLSDGKTVAQRIDETVAALRAGVDAMGGVVAFAAHVEKPVSEVSRRVNRADDGKGTRMEPFLAYVAFLDDTGFAQFIAQLCASRGYLVERARRLTDAERAEVLSSALTDDVKRGLEKRRGLPAGSLG